MFFDDHQRFAESSSTSSNLRRLNLRHAAIIDANRDILAGARVLDIASHDGRWTCAALEAGARHVTGVEPRPELVRHAQANMRAYGHRDDSYAIIEADIFDVLKDPALSQQHFDVVMCLGFLYHTLRYSELLGGIRVLAPGHLVVDTAVIRHEDRFVRVGIDRTDKESAAAPNSLAHEGRMLVGRPSVAALEMMLDLYGFTVEKYFDWQTLIAENPKSKTNAYGNGRRVTVRCTSR